MSRIAADALGPGGCSVEPLWNTPTLIGLNAKPLTCVLRVFQSSFCSMTANAVVALECLWFAAAFRCVTGV